MTFRNASVLGKRCLGEVYIVPAILPRLFSTPHLTYARSAVRAYATVTEHGPAKDQHAPARNLSANKDHQKSSTSSASSDASSSSQSRSALSPTKSAPSGSAQNETLPSPDGSKKSDSSTLNSEDWERNPNLSISEFSQLPEKNFGVNQHIIINEEFKEALRNILWKFRAPIRYAFAYGSGVFPQKEASGSSSSSSTLHPSAPNAIAKVQEGSQKMIDFIFGVSYSQHWHDINISEHRDHYSGVASLGSFAVSKLQDSFGAGCYFNPYVTVNGTLIKYGVVNIDTLCHDLSEWNTMYIAGRLQKPVKILRDNPSVRVANQINLISAVRTALLLLPPDFTEQDLYSTIAGISYMGDPRMTIGGDDPRKVQNIVRGQLTNFRRLYAPLIDTLPNISFNDSICGTEDWIDDGSINAKLAQDMDPVKRGNMVRRLPKAFREKLYFEYQAKFKIPRGDFNEMLAASSDDDKERIRRREGGEFERRIANDTEGLKTEVTQVIEKTIRWPSYTQSVKGIVTAGFKRSWRYASEKRAKNRASVAKEADETAQAEALKKKDKKDKSD